MSELLQMAKDKDMFKELGESDIKDMSGGVRSSTGVWNRGACFWILTFICYEYL